MTTTTEASATAIPSSKAACCVCGAEFAVQIPPSVAKTVTAFLQGARPICTECANKRDRKLRLKERVEKTRKELEQARSAGLITAATCKAAFAWSWPEYEQGNQEAWDYCRAKQKPSEIERESLVLYGSPGTGKSHLARCLLVRAVWRGLTAGDTNARHLIRAGKSWKSDHLDAWKRCDLLLIDDIDKADWRQGDALEILWETLDARTNANRRTIVTSNMAPADLKAYLKEHRQLNGSLADAAFERLRPYKAFEFKGDSVRAKTATPGPRE
jgi:DNA replication protein DnaC